MKTSINVLVALALVSGAYAEKEKDKDLSLEQVPANVAEAIRGTAGKAEVRISQEKEDGKEAYEAKWLAGGHKHELVVLGDGTILSQEDEIAIDAAPAPVQAAVSALAGEGKLEKIEKVTENGTTVYEAEIEGKDGDLEVKFDAAGKELAREQEKEEAGDKDGKRGKEDGDKDDDKDEDHEDDEGDDD